MEIYSSLAQMGFCFVFQFWAGQAQQNKPTGTLFVKVSMLQSGSDQSKDAKVSRFGIQDFHGHI